MTRTPLSRSKGQRSRSPGRFTHRGVNASGSCSVLNVLAVGTYCYVAVCTLQAPSVRRREALRRTQREESGGVYCGGRPPTACLSYSKCLKCLPPDFTFSLNPFLTRGTALFCGNISYVLSFFIQCNFFRQLYLASDEAFKTVSCIAPRHDICRGSNLDS